MITKAQYIAWLEDPESERIALIEAGARIAGVESTVYLSTHTYSTGPNDTPPNQVYLALVDAQNLLISEALALPTSPANSSTNNPVKKPTKSPSPTSDSASSQTINPTMSVGEVTVRNPSGELDDYLDYVWRNRPLRIYWGDPSWPRADFQLRYNGITYDLSNKDRTTFSFKYRDKTQLLNTAVSELKLSDTITDPDILAASTNKDAVVPLTIGELHNITPLLTNPATLEYQYNIGPSEGCGEVRDNGIPVSFTDHPTTGKFNLSQQPAGAITCSVQGEKPGGVYIHTIAEAVRHLAANYGNESDRFDVTTALAPGRYDFGVEQLATFARASTATFINSSGNIASVLADAARFDYSGDAAVLIEAAATNYISDSSTFSATYWSGCTVTSTASSYRGIAFKEISKALTSSSEGILTSIGSVSAGAARTATLALRADAETLSNTVSIGLYDPSGGTWWGNAGETTAEILEGPGAIAQDSTYGGVFNVTGLSQTDGTLVRLTRTFTATCTSTFNIYPGTYLSTTAGRAILATRVQVEAGTAPTSYIPTSSGPATRAADIATAWEDLDIASLNAFDAAHPQPIGLYMPSRINVIPACQQLASSIGAQINLSRRGWLRLIQIDLSSPVSTFDIHPEHMVENTLTPVQRVEVVAAVQLGFNRDWTLQPSLLTGLSAADKEMFNTEWLTATANDATVSEIYKLSTNPVQIDTLLLRRADADPEAARQLQMWKVPRTVYQFDGYAAMAQLDVGQIVTLYHPRFNLASGKVGVVVSIKSKGAASRFTIGVLI